MISKPLSQVTADDLRGLVDGRVREGKSIDYKLELPGPRDEDKREFLADISSLANAGGGHLLFGVAEVDATPTAFPGVSPADMDQEILRLENMIRSGIEPRIPGVEMRPIVAPGASRVLVIHVRQSWSMPHRVSFRDHAKFYGRNSAGKYPLDVAELRVAFTQSDTLAEKVKRFHQERLLKISSRQTPAALYDGAAFCMQVVPIGTFSEPQAVDFNSRDRLINLSAPGASGLNFRRNLDGFLNFTGEERGTSRAYTQVFRNGVIEFVGVFTATDGHTPFFAGRFEYYAVNCMKRALAFYNGCELQPPLIVFLSLLGAGNVQFVMPERMIFADPPMPLEHTDLVLPELILEESETDLGRFLRPAFDMLWNAWGFDGSMSYDSDGNWVGDR